MNGVWKHLTPQFVNNFTGFDHDEEKRKDVANLVEISKNLQLDLEEEDFEELLESHSEELTNEELMELEEMQRKEEQEETEDEPLPIKKFDTKLLAAAFSKIEEALTLLEGQDPNVERFSKVSTTIHDAMQCYHIIKDEKERKTTQTSLYSFFKPRSSTPAAESSAMPSPSPTMPSQSPTISSGDDLSDDDSTSHQQ